MTSIRFVQADTAGKITGTPLSQIRQEAQAAAQGKADATQVSALGERVTELEKRPIPSGTGGAVQPYDDSALRGQITDEATARKAGDDALASRLSAVEARPVVDGNGTVKQYDDAPLRASLADEATARKAGDAALSDRVGALEAKPAPKAYDDTALTGRVTAVEAKATANADAISSLSTSKATVASVTALSQKVDANTTAATQNAAAIKANTDALNARIPSNVQVFTTLADAKAWEASGAGRVGLVASASSTPAPAADTTAPTAGYLAATVTDTTATLSVTGAQDDVAVTGYAFKQGTGAWSAWQTTSTYAVTGLTAGTSYTWQHKVRDAAGNEATGTAVTKTTATAGSDVTDYAYQWTTKGMTDGTSLSTWTDTVKGAVMTVPSGMTTPTVTNGAVAFAGKTRLLSPKLGLTSPAAETLVLVLQSADAANPELLNTCDPSAATANALKYQQGVVFPGYSGQMAWLTGDAGATKSLRTDFGPRRDGGNKAVMVLRAGTTTKLTINGVDVPKTTGSDPAPAALDRLLLGGTLPAGPGGSHNIWAVRVYDRTLTDAEVTAVSTYLAKDYGVA